MFKKILRTQRRSLTKKIRKNSKTNTKKNGSSSKKFKTKY